MTAYIYTSSKGHIIIHRPIAFNNPVEDVHSSVEVPIHLLFQEVTKNLAEITGPVAELSEFPVNDKELIDRVSLWEFSPPNVRNENTNKGKMVVYELRGIADDR